MNHFNRRQLIGWAGLVTLGGLASRLTAAAAETATFLGQRIFDVKDQGAQGDGRTLDSAAINRAVDACHANGGGLVYVPPGTYLCGTVVLKSNVTLYLEAGAILLGSKHILDYTPKPFHTTSTADIFGNDKQDTTERHLIYARDATNVILTGFGTIDGQGPSFWVPSNRVAPAAADAWKDVATYDWKATNRPSPMLEFYNCKNLRIENVQIKNAPGWTLRPIDCDNVFIQGITIKNPIFGINTDGIDVTGCQNVFISDCLIDTGDDAICLKSESPYGGTARLTKNVTITNCTLTCCCNGLKFGTATYGGFENIMFSNSVIFNAEVALNQRVISGVALEMVDGGSLEGVMISNIRMQRVRTPIFIRRGIRRARADGSPGILRSVMFQNIHATGSILTSSLTGLPGFEVEDVSLSNIRIDSEEAGPADWVNREIPDVAKAYPEARMYGRLPAYGLYCRHVKGLRLRQLEFGAAENEARPVLFCDDVKDLEVEGLRSASIQGTQPVIKLRQTQQALIRGSTAPQGTETYLEVQGSQTRQVVLLANNLVAAKKMVQIHPDVPEKNVTVTGNASGEI
ncbi:MAG TPA: glycoside hydrolase family 28 protein [Verrucomicrobiae bacterium]|jgi:hypothetical protein